MTGSMNATTVHRGTYRVPIEERFWAKVDKGPGCWEWQAFRTHGYGRLGLGGAGGGSTAAHRVAWELANGPVPDGLYVCHHCDNRACVKTEPDERYPDGHLFLGTQTDNMQDALKKGRTRSGSLPGESNPYARLTSAQAEKIRALRGHATQPQIAAMFGVSRSCVSHVLSGRTWRAAIRDGTRARSTRVDDDGDVPA